MPRVFRSWIPSDSSTISCAIPEIPIDSWAHRPSAYRRLPGPTDRRVFMVRHRRYMSDRLRDYLRFPRGDFEFMLLGCSDRNASSPIDEVVFGYVWILHRSNAGHDAFVRKMNDRIKDLHTGSRRFDLHHCEEFAEDFQRSYFRFLDAIEIDSTSQLKLNQDVKIDELRELDMDICRDFFSDSSVPGNLAPGIYRFSLDRMGFIDIVEICKECIRLNKSPVSASLPPKPAATNTVGSTSKNSIEMKETYAHQIYLFIKDIWHNHNHHSDSDDALIIPIAIQNPRSTDLIWARRISGSLYDTAKRRKEYSPRQKDLRSSRYAVSATLGLLAYAEAFKASCHLYIKKKKHLPANGTSQILMFPSNKHAETIVEFDNIVDFNFNSFEKSFKAKKESGDTYRTEEDRANNHLTRWVAVGLSMLLFHLAVFMF